MPVKPKQLDITDILFDLIIDNLENEGKPIFKEIDTDIEGIHYKIDIDFLFKTINKNGLFYINHIFVSGYANTIDERFDLYCNESIIKRKVKEIGFVD